MSYGWIKHFSDNTIENGSDLLISSGKASWSRGRLTDISFVELYNNSSRSILSVSNTTWHQFDRYASIATPNNTSSSRLLYQVIQSEIKSEHAGLYLYKKNHIFTLSTKVIKTGYDDKMILDDPYVGKWLALVLYPNCQTPYLFLSDRGRLNVDKRIFR
jgi:hypothetical protein